MSRATHTDADSDDRALQERLKLIVSHNSQSEVARKTGIAQQNIARYLQGVRIPGSAIAKIVRGMGVNPAWLVAGEGTPYLSDVTSDTSAMAGGLLELVKAMGAVTKMRLGALAGKHHLKTLRELNDALVQYEHLKQEMSAQSDGIYRKLLEDLRQALSGGNYDQAASTCAAAEQVSRLSESESLKTELLHLKAWLYAKQGNPGQAVEYAREAFLRSVGGEGAQSPEFLNRCRSLVNTLRHHGSLSEGYRMCCSLLELIGPQRDDDAGYLNLLCVRGTFETELGQLLKGMSTHLRYIPRLPVSERGEMRVALIRAQMWSGALTFKQALAIPIKHSWRDSVMAAHAIMLDDPEAWALAHKALKDSEQSPARIDTPVLIALLDFLLCAHRKDRTSLKKFDAYCAGVYEPESRTPRWLLMCAICRTKLTRVLEHAEQASSLKREIELFDAFDDKLGLGIPMRASHYSNVLHAPPASLKASGKPARQEAEAFFRDHYDAGYLCFERWRQ